MACARADVTLMDLRGVLLTDKEEARAWVANKSTHGKHAWIDEFVRPDQRRLAEALGRMGEPEARTVLYFSVGTTLAGAVAMLLVGPSEWVWPHAMWLLPIGLLAALGQLCMTKAYSSGATLVVANLPYSGIVFAALYGLFLFGDQIPLVGWAGMALIVASGIAATALRNRTLPRAPAEEH
jgi:S-adenosylmethionine uptake transporter